MKNFTSLLTSVILLFALFSISPARAQEPCTPNNQTAQDITAHSAVLSWENLSGHTWVRYAPVGSQQYKFKFADSSNTVELHFLLAETDYTWEINTLCDSAWTGYNWPASFTTIQDTVVCEPVNQMAENITAHTADLSWEGLTGPTWVRYYIAGTEEYRYKFAQENNQVSLNWLLAETDYMWEVNTLCNGTWTGYNWPAAFSTIQDTVVCEPVNQMAENITAHTADLSWEGLTGSTWVRYYVAGTEEYRYKFAQENNQVSLNWLLAETDYVWELNTLCNGVWTGYNWPATFSTIQDTVVCEPVNQLAENITAHTADLSWEGLTGPTWVRFYKAGTQEYRYRYAQQNNQVSLSCLAAEADYMWEINTLCNGTWTGYNWPAVFTTIQDTVVCEPVNQMAENITAHTTDLSWEGLTGPTWVRYFKSGTAQYRYNYADTSNMASLLFLDADSEYTWELNTYCNGMWTGYNWPQTFTSLEDTTVMSCTPENLAAFNISSTSADLSWEAIQGPTYVRYFIAGTQEYQYAFTTETTLGLTELVAASDYEWQINNFCQGAWTGYNTSGQFTTLADSTGGSDFRRANYSQALYKVTAVDELEITNLNAFPNPTNQKSAINFTSQIAGEYSVRVVDMLGNIVIEKNLTSVSGLNNFTIDLEKQSNGLYFVVLNQNNTSAKIKIVKR